MSDPGDWDSAPCGLVTLHPDGTIAAANAVLLAWTGRAPDDVVGRVRFSDLLSVGGRLYWETHLAPRLQLEGSLEEVTVELRSATGRVPVLLSAAAAAGRPGFHLALAGARERVRFERELRTAREQEHRAVDRLQTLQTITAALSRAPGMSAVTEALLTAATGALGASAATLFTTRDGVLRLRASRGETMAPPPTRSGHGSDSRPWESDGRVHVPLHGASGVRGLLSLQCGRGEPEVGVLTAVGQQAGLALDRAAMYEQSVGVAHALQHAMLAVDPPVDARYAVGATYQAGVELLEVGGDWYDVFTAGPGVLGVVVGDVVGRGLAAASAMGQLRSAVRAVAEPGLGPAGVLTRLDRFVDQVPTAQMATVAYAELELGTGVLTYACAGHPPPLLSTGRGAGADPSTTYLWGGRSTPLGTGSPGRSRTQTSVQLHSGDRVLLYTDGLVERRDRGLDEGMAALARAVTDLPGRPLTETTDAVTAVMLAGEDGSDDVCALLLAWNGAPSA